MLGGNSLLPVTLQVQFASPSKNRMKRAHWPPCEKLHFKVGFGCQSTGTREWLSYGTSSSTVKSLPHDSLTSKPRLRDSLYGTTGFLGSTVVDSLFERPGLGNIDHTAVKKGHADVIPATSKVVVHDGNCLDSTPGLPTAEYTVLQSCFDAMGQCGPNVHCLNNHHSVRTSNFPPPTSSSGSCCGRRSAALHPTASNHPPVKGDMPGAVCILAPPVMAGSAGFMTSKCASECFFEQRPTKPI